MTGAALVTALLIGLPFAAASSSPAAPPQRPTAPPATAPERPETAGAKREEGAAAPPASAPPATGDAATAPPPEAAAPPPGPQRVGIDEAEEFQEDLAEAMDEALAVEAAAAPAAPSRPRVYIVVDRRTEVRGWVEHEDDDTIVISWKEQTLSYPKSRLSQIIRLVEPAPGQIGTVIMRDGQRRRGIVLEDGFDEVVLEIEGIRTTLPRKLVDAVHLEPTFEQTVARLRSLIDDDNWPRRLELARWMVDERRYAEAAEELRTLVARSDLPEAPRLLRQVEAQLAMGAPPPPRGSRSGAPGSGGPDRRTGPVELRDMLPHELLTAEDVNIIRVYEMDLRNPPRLAIAPDTVRRLIEEFGSSDLIPARVEERNRLFREDPVKLVSLMFKLKARDLYPEIRVLSEPPHLNLFRQRVHNTWLVPNCATSRCHGGVDSGRFFLHSRNYKDERVRYTNLLIVDRLRLDGQPLVDWDDPMMSTIIQHALPRNQARFPHPNVPGWRPVFNDGNRRLLEDSLTWIREMYRPRPAYPVEFEPPVLDAPDRAETGDDDFPVDR
ncbi:MAG TPA: hypothetical protein PKC43_03400 [Phycisphaerales bacterium]|nr:hypothetical protein [Phycisphaerales bacterium]HMP36475.1 hypothetical protein [Phycisphaerales bacterium]